MKYINKKQGKNIKFEKNNYYVVLDFDKTITRKESIDSWMATIDFEMYEKDCQKQWEKLNQEYAPIEVDYRMDYETKKQAMVDWYKKSMDLLYHYQLTIPKMKQAMQKNPFVFREGAKEFLQKLNQQGVIVIIISAGIGNVIEEFLKEQECYFENMYIISNFIEFREEKMQKYTKPLIHSMNKSIEGKLPKKWQEKIREKPYSILCGDIVEDCQMLPQEKRNQTLRIGFLNQEIQKNLKTYQENFDIVLTNDEATFYEVEKIIK